MTKFNGLVLGHFYTKKAKQLVRDHGNELKSKNSSNLDLFIQKKYF